MLPSISEVNSRLRDFAEHTPNIRYFDVNADLCSAGVCAAYWPSGEPRYSDSTHLALPAARRLGRDILEREGLPAAFGEVATWGQDVHRSRQ